MGDWCISRKRYWGLPLPFYQCPEGHLTVVGSKEELLERATQGIEGLEELHRPWIDPVRIRCGECECESERVPEVGDCWLDAGIVPFSTLGYGRDEYLPEGFAAGAGEGLTKADLPDHAYWERWFPADWISEMREQIRLWFYSQLFMSVALTGQAPYRSVLGYEKLNDEVGRPMHKSWGNAIWFDDAIEKMGADVMRWLFAGQAPGQNMSFGFGPAETVRRRLHPLWNSYRFLALNAGPEGFRPDPGRARARAPLGAPARPLAARARPGAGARRARRARPLVDARVRAGMRGVLRRSLELVRARLAPALLGGRPDGVRRAAPRARARRARDRARDAVPRRGALGGSRRRPARRRGARLGAPRGLSRGRRRPARRGAAGRDGERPRSRRARPPGTRRGPAAPAPAVRVRRDRIGRPVAARRASRACPR